MAAVAGVVVAFTALLEGTAGATPPLLANGGALVVPGGAVNFGHTVGISGATAIVGAPGTSSNQGAAYLYVRGKTGAWPVAPSATLVDPASTNGDDFGVAVAVSGRYAIVGADGTNALTGSAYIYKRTGSVWATTPVATLSYPSPAANDQFGISVALSGATAIVGAGMYASNGAAFLYQRVGTTWPLKATLTDSAADPHWGFGEPVAISGNTAIVSASGADSGGCGTAPCGAVDVFVKPISGWTATGSPTARLSDPAGLQNDYFGNAIAIFRTNVLVGDFNAYPPDAGPAYVFVRPGSGWLSTSTPTATLPDPAPATDDSFGLAVAITGSTALVGAYTAPLGSAGDVYVFRKVGATWPPVPTAAKNPWPVPAGTAFFGIALGISGTTAIVGAPAGTGDSYIFRSV